MTTPNYRSKKSEDTNENPNRQDDNEDTFSSRLMAALGDEDVAPFARRAGIPASTMHSITKGVVPRADTAVRIATSLGVSVEWLVTGAVGQSTAPPAMRERGNARGLPLVAELGGGPSAGQEPVDHVVLPPETLVGIPGLRSDIWLVAMPSATMGDLCAQGDLLICQQPDRSFVERGVYIFDIHGLPDVRRVKRTPDGVQLVADHPKVEPILAFADGPARTGSSVRILARVAGAIRVTAAG